MAQQKRNIQYFSHDVDMRNDMRVKALRRKYGSTGYAVWCFLLETMTDTDTLDIELNDITMELLSVDFEVETQQLQEIIDFMIRIGLLQEEDGRVYSRHHQERIEEALAKFGYMRQIRSEAGKASAEARRAARREQNITEPTETSRDINKPEQTSNKNQQTSTNVQQPTTTSNNITELNRTEKKHIHVSPEFEDRIVELWNQTVGNPKVAKLTDDRRRKIRARVDEWKCATEEEAVQKVLAIFSRISASDFLSGRSGDWRANFDWVFMNDRNYMKVLEGNYDNRQCVAKTAPVTSDPRLGAGEYITEDGRRTYGTGRATIPMDAPARPSARYGWDAATKKWIMQ